MAQAPELATGAVLSRSEELPEGTTVVRGYDFEDGKVDYDDLLSSYAATGFQASNFGKAIEIVNNMVRPACVFSREGSVEGYRANRRPPTL